MSESAEPPASGDHIAVGPTSSAPAGSADPADSGTDQAGGRIARSDVAHLARLARLAVTEEELDVFAEQLDVILGAVARVREVAAEDIPPTSHAVPMTNVYRADVVIESLPRDDVLAAAPAVENDRFRVPRILAEEV